MRGTAVDRMVVLGCCDREGCGTAKHDGPGWLRYWVKARRFGFRFPTKPSQEVFSVGRRLSIGLLGWFSWILTLKGNEQQNKDPMRRLGHCGVITLRSGGGVITLECFEFPLLVRNCLVRLRYPSGLLRDLVLVPICLHEV